MSQEQDKIQSDIHAKQPLLKPTSWLAQLDFINHLLLFNNVMLVALAEQSGGKSTFSHFLQQHLAETFDIYIAQCPIPYDEKEIAIGLANHLNLAKPDHASIEDICHQVNERNHHTLVILDDAHRLSDQQINAYLNIVKSQAESPSFHLLLVADYSLLPSLNKLNDKDNDDAIHSIEIGSFAKDEIKTYLHQKLTDEHLQNLINNNNCEQFYQLTKGVVSIMNREVEPFFSSLIKSNRKLFKRLSQVTALAAMILVGFVGIRIWQNSEVEHPSLIAKLQELDVNVPKAISSAEKNKQLKSTVSYAESYFPLISHISKIKLPYEDLEVDSHLAAINVESFHFVAKNELKSKIYLTKAKLTSKLENKVSKTSEAKTAKMDTTKLIVKAGVTEQPNLADVTKNGDSKLVSIQFAKEPPKKSDIPPKYTIQLVATHQIKFLNALIAKHPVSAIKIYTYPVSQEGKQWYVLTAGRFANWSDAHDAIAKLPLEYKQFKPWIRPIDKG